MGYGYKSLQSFFIVEFLTWFSSHNGINNVIVFSYLLIRISIILREKKERLEPPQPYHSCIYEKDFLGEEEIVILKVVSTLVSINQLDKQ